MRRSTRWIRTAGPARIAMLVIAVLIGLLALFPGIVTRYGVSDIDATSVLQGFSAEHWLGTDEAGADLLARVLDALRLELLMAGGSVLLALAAGVPTGLLAGYRGGAFDELLTSVATAILSFPIVLLAVLVVAGYGASLKTLVLVLAFVFYPRVHMLVRAQAQSLKQRQFVLAARAVGAGELRIVARHILPNTIGPLSVLTPQLMAVAILTEAGLSYVGLGVQPPSVTWGTLLQTSKNYYVQSSSYAITIGVVVTVAAALLLIAGDLASQSANPLRRRLRRWSS
jgi:peptide/nickel transport system permease protein